MDWQLSNRADPIAARLADRHYSRQKIGSQQFVPPGRCLVLRTEDGDAYWVTAWPFAEYVKHDWAGAWMCSAFRNESNGRYLSSDLINQAVAATRWFFGEPPDLGFITFIDTTKVRKKRDWGRCYRKAGWTPLKETTGKGLFVLQLLPENMPGPEQPFGSQLSLLGAAG